MYFNPIACFKVNADKKRDNSLTHIFPRQGLNPATLLQPLPFTLHNLWVDPHFFDWVSRLRQRPIREDATP